MKGKLVTGTHTGTWYFSATSDIGGGTPAYEVYDELTVTKTDRWDSCMYCSRRGMYLLTDPNDEAIYERTCGKHAPHLVEEAADEG
jgi:hypothetical protein